MPKIALVHDWFTSLAGSEKVVRQMLQVFPQADLFSLVDFLPTAERAFLAGYAVHSSFLQRAPFARRHYRFYLPLMPLAIERFDLSGYDIILSSCHAVAKGVLTGPDQLHISYIHTPIRYAWEMQNEYLTTGGVRGVARLAARAILHYIRQWDFVAAQRPEALIANSRFVANRIHKTYRREAHIIHPPVDTDYFTPSGPRENFYLTASRLVPYKRVDLTVEAFNAMPDKKLVVIGDGPEAPKIKRLCGPNVTWLGYQPDDVLRDHLRCCKAFVFAAKEDFGILPVEAQACGTPVIAYAMGGAAETVIPSPDSRPTGILYPEQDSAKIRAAVEDFAQDPGRFHPENCRRNAERFSSQRFRDEFGGFVHSTWGAFEKAGH